MGKRRSEKETIKSDNLLVEFLLAHKGKANVVSSKEIAKYLTDCGYGITVQSVNVKVKRVMKERRLPICHLSCYGYYWANTKDELKESIADLESRIMAMNEHITHLKSFIFD